MQKRFLSRRISTANKFIASSVLAASIMACNSTPKQSEKKELDYSNYKPQPTSGPSTTVSKSPVKPPVVKTFRIGIMGDSITHGVDFRNRYPDTLEKILKEKFPKSNVDAYGKCGHTTKQQKQRFAADILGKGYDTVIIQGGTNDLYGGSTVEPIQKNLTEMIEAAKKAGLRVVLVTVGPCNEYPKWTPGKEQRKQELNQWIMQYPGVIAVDTQTVLSQGNPPTMKSEYFHKDYIHPNGKGLDAMAKAIAHALETQE